MTARFNFKKNKYNKETLIDCFSWSEVTAVEKPTSAFIITFYEIIFVTRGEGSIDLDHKKIHFKPGTVLFLPPNRWRNWTKGNSQFEAQYLIFEEEFITNFFNDPLYLYRLNYYSNSNATSFLDLSIQQQLFYAQILDKITHEIKYLKGDSNHMLRALLYTLLISLNRDYNAAYHLQKPLQEETNILKFRQLLEKHIRSKQRVTDYVDLLKISSSYLNKLLKKHLDKSCSDMIKERLILEVKRELQFSDKTISEISHALSFSEPSNFIRFFQSQTGLSPKSYRLQNDNS